MAHLDPRRTNRSPYRGPARPAVAWNVELHHPIETAPALLSDGTVVVGTFGASLVGISPQGQQRFSVDLRDRVYASPLVVDDTIFVGSDDDRFFAISAKGTVRWTLVTDGDADTSPTVTPSGHVVFAAGQTMFSVRRNGSVQWRVKAKRKVFGSPAVAPDGTVYFGAQDNRLYAVRKDGKVAFALALGADVDCAPSVGDDSTVYVGTDAGHVVAVSGESVRWKADVGGYVRGGLTLTRDRAVVAGVYGPSPRVVKLDAASGELLWSFAVPGTGAKEFGVHGSPVEDREGNLYFGSQDDAVYSLSPDGKLRWKLGTGADVDAPVVLAADGLMYVACDDGKLYAVREQ